MPKPIILIIEDEDTLRRSIAQSLELDGYVVREAEGLGAGSTLLDEEEIGVVITDVNLPDGSGLNFARSIREEGFVGGLIVMTAYGTIDTAVEAMRVGADDFLQKPVRLDELSVVLQKVIDQRAARSKLSTYQRLDRIKGDTERPLGTSESWRAALAIAERYSQLPIPDANGSDGDLPTILLLGETGAGKGVLARHIHESGPDHDPENPSPFVHVNCAALPANLIEGELFGNEKGAYTDAKGARPGLFEIAEGGTIFLDEIGEVPIEMQAKLLLVVENGTFRRLGGTRERRVRTRIIAATNQDLEERVEEGTFRNDLLFRLNALTVNIPSLRERDGDALLIAEHFLKKMSREIGKAGLCFDNDARRAIEAHAWHGNVRELINCLKRAAILTDGPTISADDLGLRETGPGRARALQKKDAQSLRFSFERGPISFEDLERALIHSALEHADGNVSQAARLIGLNRGALRYRIERLGVEEVAEGKK